MCLPARRLVRGGTGERIGTVQARTEDDEEHEHRQQPPGDPLGGNREDHDVRHGVGGDGDGDGHGESDKV
jgi:hypothetical protein